MRFRTKIHLWSAVLAIAALILTEPSAATARSTAMCPEDIGGIFPACYSDEVGGQCESLNPFDVCGELFGQACFGSFWVFDECEEASSECPNDNYYVACFMRSNS